MLMTHVYIEMTPNTVLCGKLGRHSCRFLSRKKQHWLVLSDYVAHVAL